MTNDEYVETWRDHPWFQPVQDAHDLLSHFIPGYQITQITDRAGRDLRFNYVLPVDMDGVQLYKMLADHIIGWAIVRCNLITSGLDRTLLRRRVPAEEE